jgi:hypothetical protein
MLANLKNIKQAVLLNLDEDNQMHILAGVPNPFAFEQSNSDLESVSNDSDRKMFKVRRNRSNSSRRLAKLVNLSEESNSLNKVKSVSNESDSESNNILEDIFDGLQMINLSDNSSHRHQIARVNHSEDTHSVDSLLNLSDDGFMQAYCRSLGYGTDNCRKWAGYSAKSGSTNIASAKSDSDNDNKSTSSFTDSDDSRDGDSSSNSALSEYLMQLNMASKLGKGIEFMHKKAVKARDYGKKVSPALHDLWKVAAPKNHDKYSPQLDEAYDQFNKRANQAGGWGAVTQVEDKLKSMKGKSRREIMCELLENEALTNSALFSGKTMDAISYRTALQTQIENLGCY